MWRTVRIRSTASSMYGLHWLTISNPRLCERIRAIEYHITPSPYNTDNGFSNPLNFGQHYEYFDQKTFQMTIGQVVPPWAQPQASYERYRRLQHPEIEERERGRRTTPLEYSNNFRHAESTFYNHQMDFTYFVGMALAGRSFPNLRKLTVSCFADEEFSLWWQRALKYAADRGVQNTVLTGIPADEVFEKPEAGFLPDALLRPAIRAFFVVLYGLWRRNTQKSTVSPVCDLTFQWLPPDLDLMPNYWQYWTPAALQPITHFSCSNISNELPMPWVFGYFRFHILRHMFPTVEVLKLGYSRWHYQKPLWIHRQRHYYSMRARDHDGWENNYNQKKGSVTNNVLPVFALIMPFIENPGGLFFESVFRRDFDPQHDPLSQAASNTQRDLVLHLERTILPAIFKILRACIASPAEQLEVQSLEENSEDDGITAFLRLQELHLKPWLSVSEPALFPSMFGLYTEPWDERLANAGEPQYMLRRLHLEGFNLPLKLRAQLDESTGLMVNGWLRDSWADLIQRIETRFAMANVRGTDPMVSHDNLWQDVTDPQYQWQWISVPGGGRIIGWDRAYTDKVFIKPWGECWSWMGNEAKQNEYLERVANNLPFDFSWVMIVLMA